MTATDTTAVKPAILMSPAAPNISMSPLELDGYLTGIAVTPQTASILPERWIVHLWDDKPDFDDDLQIKLVLGPVINRYNALGVEIDRSLKRLETDKIVDYRPRFLSGDQKPPHDTVRAWVRGFWKAMALAPQIWNALIEDERTKVIIQPLIAFFDLGELEPDEIPANLDDLLDEHAALIPRMILVLRKLARVRLENADAHRRPRKNKVGRNDPCPCGSGQKFKRCCGGQG
jgi:uncharacterized protein